jgi:outer membrane protein
MRKTPFLFLFFLLIFSFSTWAQTEKGSKLLGGSANFSFEKNYSFGISPQIGYFITNNFALGTGVSISYSKFDNDDTMGNGYRSHTTAAGISPFIRYYFGKASSTRLFTQGAVVFQRFWQNSSINGGEPQVNAENFSTFRVGVGVVHFITQQVGLEALVDYSASKYGVGDRTSRVALNIGLQIYLPSAKQ